MFDVVPGETCLTCGGGDWALSDSGGRVCLNCQADQESNVEPEKSKPCKAKIDTAFGNLVRECEKAGLYDKLKDVLDSFAKALKEV